MLFAAKTFVKNLGRSSGWPRLRKEWLAEHPTCEACGTKTKCEVHHKLPYSFAPQFELIRANLQTLCEYHNCHLLIGHGGNYSDFNPYAVEDAARQLSRIQKRIKRGVSLRTYDRTVSELLREFQELAA